MARVRSRQARCSFLAPRGTREAHGFWGAVIGVVSAMGGAVGLGTAVKLVTVTAPAAGSLASDVEFLGFLLF